MSLATKPQTQHQDTSDRPHHESGAWRGLEHSLHKPNPSPLTLHSLQKAAEGPTFFPFLLVLVQLQLEGISLFG